ncbi:MAG: hypothetical protein IKE65_07440 [Clostridia bacterium]|nr:hypothetical protein [Clostridia bacterium]
MSFYDIPVVRDFLTILFIQLIIILIAASRIFKKAGEKGWKVLIPFYNLYIFSKIVEFTGNGKKFILFFIPVVRYYYYFFFNLRLAQAFDRNPYFGVGLMVCPSIFMSILAFSKAKYVLHDDFFPML